MEISWALNINHLNFLNLRNCSIFQSINRGLGEGFKEMNIGEKSYVGGIYLEVLEQQNSKFFGCRGVLVSGVGLYTYLIHYC